MCDVANPAGHGDEPSRCAWAGATGKEGTKLLKECQSEGKVKNGRLESM